MTTFFYFVGNSAVKKLKSAANIDDDGHMEDDFNDDDEVFE